MRIASSHVTGPFSRLQPTHMVCAIRPMEERGAAVGWPIGLFSLGMHAASMRKNRVKCHAVIRQSKVIFEARNLSPLPDTCSSGPLPLRPPLPAVPSEPLPCPGHETGDPARSAGRNAKNARQMPLSPSPEPLTEIPRSTGDGFQAQRPPRAAQGLSPGFPLIREENRFVTGITVRDLPHI